MSPEEKKETHQVGLGGIKSLRTYETDVAEALGQNNVTVAQMAIAENAQKATEEIAAAPTPVTPSSPQKPPMIVRAPEVISNAPVVVEHPVSRNTILFFMSVILLAGGGMAGYYFYSKSPLAPAIIQIQQKGVYRGLLSSNTQKKIFLGSLIGKRLEDVLAYEKTQVKLEPGQVIELYFVKGTETEPFLITPAEFISLSTTQAPDAIKNSLADRFMFGFHKTDISVESFMVLKTNFFQNIFTGMLRWEPIMFDDMKSWFASQATGGTTFEDKIIRNKDVRLTRNLEGVVVLVYGFLDKETLAITTSEATFLEILDRFEKQTYVR